MSAPVLQGTTGGESDSVSSPGARSASATMFVDAEGVGESRRADDELVESVDMNGIVMARLEQALSKPQAGKLK